MYKLHCIVCLRTLECLCYYLSRTSILNLYLYAIFFRNEKIYSILIEEFLKFC